jgi:hypothetical protein
LLTFFKPENFLFYGWKDLARTNQELSLPTVVAIDATNLGKMFHFDIFGGGGGSFYLG